MALSPLQERFAYEYVIDFNATQAAIRAGYAKGSAHVQGNRMLRNDKVAAFIAKLKEKQFEHLGATRERVIEELGKVAFSDPRKLFGEDGNLRPIGSLAADVAAFLSGFDVAESGDGETVKKVRLLPKVSALDLLAKHFNLYEDHKQGGAETEIHIHMTEQDMRL